MATSSFIPSIHKYILLYLAVEPPVSLTCVTNEASKVVTPCADLNFFIGKVKFHGIKVLWRYNED
jgi:hypothetical protein